MTFTVTIPVANIAAANAALQAAGWGPNNFSVPLWTGGAMPSVASLHHAPNDPAFQAACAALAGATVRTFAGLSSGMDATATAVGGRWGQNAPLLQGNVTPGLYRATAADGGALWWVIQAFDRTVFNAALTTYPALVTPARTPGEVTPWVQPLGGADSYQAANPFTGQPDRVTHAGKTWDCLTATNVSTPGTANWREYVTTGYPAWLQPSGAGDAYPVGFRVTHLGQNWQNTSPANTNAPGVFGWVTV